MNHCHPGWTQNASESIFISSQQPAATPGVLRSLLGCEISVEWQQMQIIVTVGTNYALWSILQKNLSLSFSEKSSHKVRRVCLDEITEIQLSIWNGGNKAFEL